MQRQIWFYALAVVGATLGLGLLILTSGQVPARAATVAPGAALASAARAVAPLQGTPTPTVCPGAQTFQGSITNSDSSHNAYVDLISGHPSPSTCALPPTCPGVASDPSNYHYDTYTLTNSSGSAQCMLVTVDGSGCNSQGLWAFAYLTSYNPANLCQNYLADAGSTRIVAPTTFSFNVPSGATFVLEIEEYSSGEGCASYTVLATRASCAATPTATSGVPTATVTLPPATATRTVTPVGPTATLTPSPSPPAPSGTPTRTVTPGGPTATPTATAPPTATPGPPTATITPGGPTFTPAPTAPPSATLTVGPSATPGGPVVTATPCAVQFTDVPSGSTFYDYVRCLACRGIVGGYPCGGPGEPCPGTYFRPNTNVTRGQVSKIVSESAGFQDGVPSTQQTFADVPPGGTFWLWIERLSSRGVIGGYPCGGTFEPCVAPGNRPYFRPNNQVTRGQLSKIVSGAAGWTETPTAQTFADVAPGSTFYLYVERVASRGIVGGYPCGGAFEPCVAPGNRPYFRPNNNATRGQMSKIAANAFFPGCATPAGRSARP